MSKYDPKNIEQKWHKYWSDNPALFAADDKSEKEKKYILDMFPYPSGDGLHVGHVESYTATDIISRFLRMNGKNVLHPQGFDAFGLPAENFAIKTGVHPSETTKKAIETFKRQINSMGFSYDWSREVNTSSPEYYKWTQWFFLLLYKNGLAYKKMGKVNWCPSCQTVLANEQVENGVCERCKNEVIQKDMEQWFFKITDFIEDSIEASTVAAGSLQKTTSGLLNGLEKIDWPDSTKAAQRNWIGKSEGTEFELRIKNHGASIKVYTTRIDTVFGVTYVVVAPEHPIIKNLLLQAYPRDKSKISNLNEVEEYIKESKNKSDLMRMEEKEKTGVEIKGVKVINPFNNEEVPIFVADYVLGQYGTGAVMAVPAHDERDWEFAKKHDLPIKEVISGEKSGKEININDGVLVSSKEYDGLTSEKAREKMTEWLEKEGIGKKKINYKLRDWLISRQRYWGAPIPIVYCEKCGTVPVPEKDLPVMLPTDVDFKPTGESPLKYSKTFQDVKCPQCDGAARRESDTMDTFVCSSWYYFRYADPKNENEFASKEMLKKWLPVDIYVGGAEHSVLHLLYARFFTKVLHNLGYIDFDEPFLQMRHQGIIMAEDGRKMSKSLGNVVNPDQVVAEFGADALRMFEMFMGPLEAMKPWNTKGITGVCRFLEKIYKLNFQFPPHRDKLEAKISNFQTNSKTQITNSKLETLLHKTIKKVTEDIENFRFNTAISKLMILVNAMEKEESLSRSHFTTLLTLLAPFAPHISEELWNKLGNKESIFLQSWPQYNPELIKEEEIEMVVQVNGKLRDRIFVAPDVTEDEAKETALESEKVKVFTQGKEIKKVIFVAGKLINIVI